MAKVIRWLGVLFLLILAVALFLAAFNHETWSNKLVSLLFGAFLVYTAYGISGIRVKRRTITDEEQDLQDTVDLIEIPTNTDGSNER